MTNKQSEGYWWVIEVSFTNGHKRLKINYNNKKVDEYSIQ